MSTPKGDAIFGAVFLLGAIGVSLILDTSYWPVAVAVAALILYVVVGMLRDPSVNRPLGGRSEPPPEYVEDDPDDY